MADGNGQRGLVKWAGPKAAHKRYVQALLQTRMHLIICLRAKEKVRQLTAADTLPPGRKVSPQPRASTWLISSPSLVLPSRMVASVIGSGGAAMRRALSTARLTACARRARRSRGQWRDGAPTHGHLRVGFTEAGSTLYPACKSEEARWRCNAPGCARGFKAAKEVMRRVGFREFLSNKIVPLSGLVRPVGQKRGSK